MPSAAASPPTARLSTTTAAANLTFTSTGLISGATNTFNLPVIVPYTDVPSLAGNTSFDQVEISAATLSTGTLALNLLGTNATNFSYQFPNGFTIGSGGTLAVGPNVPGLTLGQTLSDAGTLTFSSGDLVTVDNPAQIAVSGSLSANGTTFNYNGGSVSVVVNSGGDLIASASTFGVPLSLASGSTDNLQYVAFSTQLTINSGATINITSDDFTNGTVVASGNANATISLIDNFWGTINPTLIAAKITGHTNNASLPYVTYDPFLSENPTATNAPITWNTTAAPTGGDWDTPGNWVGGNVPGPSNAVVIDLTGSGTVTHSTNTADSVLSLTTNSSTTLSLGDGSITLGAGSSTFGGPVTVGAAGTLSVGAGASVVVSRADAERRRDADLLHR